MDYKKTTIIIGTTVGGVKEVTVDGVGIMDALSEDGIDLMFEVNAVANAILAMKQLIAIGKEVR